MTSSPIAERRNPELASLAGQHGLSVAGARPPLFKYIHDTWNYRHFTSAFSTAGVVSALGQHRLGRLWQVLTPLSNAAVYYLIFGVIINTSRGLDSKIFLAYLCIGVFFFTFTSQAVQQGVQSITKNVGMIRALHFPRAALPISSTLTQLQNLLASMLVLIAIVLITGQPIRWQWLLLLPALLLQSIFNGGLAMIMARVGNKITDLKQVLPFIIRTWMYASGVMYPATTFDRNLPGPLAHLALANPLVVFIEIARRSLLILPKKEMVLTWPSLWILAVGWAVVLGIGGFIYFWMGEQEYGRG